MSALYRKYRPQTFAEVVGQEAVVRTLSNALQSGKIRQAYLFAGPRGTGKTSFARILAKSVNCTLGPTPTPDNTCHACVAITNGTSLDVIEMDAASQRGIDDVREIRERVLLAPVEGHSKVYIIDEAHQLTDAAWNALLKLIEEPPPHLLFIFCTTELYKVLPTVRSRCQTFVFQRPRLPELVRKLRLIADAEAIEAPDAALALIARSGHGAFRDAESTLDQLATATGGKITVREVLDVLGAVEDEVLFRLCDLVVDANTAGALELLEDLSERGQDIARVVSDLLEHLRQLMLVQHTGEVPETLPVTEESRERLREQANQLGAASVMRLIDLLHGAVEDMRQGADPRLLLELALVKVTRPGSDLSLESLAFRMARLEEGRPAAPAADRPPRSPDPGPPRSPVDPDPGSASSAESDVSSFSIPELRSDHRSHDGSDSVSEPVSEAVSEPLSETVAVPVSETVSEPLSEPSPEPVSELVSGPDSDPLPQPVPDALPALIVSDPAPYAGLPALGLEQLQDAWQRTVLPALERRSIPASVMLREARPAELSGDTLTLEFPLTAAFHREKAEEPKTADLLVEALFEVTGRRLQLAYATGATPADTDSDLDHPATEQEIVELVKSTFDAQELSG